MRGDVSVLGLGDMGQALAGAFLDAGRRTVVWNRTAARADALVARGAQRAADAGQAVRAAPLVVVCPLDHSTVRRVPEPLAEELRGRTVVDLTNGSPAQAAELAGWAAGAGITYLDGGIMAVPGTIASPGAFVLYSGPKEAFSLWRADLEVLGAAHRPGEDTGLASLYDIALLSAMEMLFTGFNLAVAMATSRPGGSAPGVTELLVPWLADMGALMPAFAAEIDADAAGGTPPRLTQGLDVQTAGMLNMVATAQGAGVGTEWLDPSLARLRALAAEGHDTWSAPLGVRQLRTAAPGK